MNVGVALGVCEGLAVVVEVELLVVEAVGVDEVVLAAVLVGVKLAVELGVEVGVVDPFEVLVGVAVAVSGDWFPLPLPEGDVGPLLEGQPEINTAAGMNKATRSHE